MANGENSVADRMIEDQRRRSRAEEEMYSRQMRTDAIGIGQLISKESVRKPEVALPRIIGFLMPAAEGCRALTPYESEPIANALLYKAEANMVDAVYLDQLRRLDQDTNGWMTNNPDLQAALAIYDASELGDNVTLSPDQEVALSEYAKLMEEREGVLGMMSGGVSTLMAEASQISFHVRMFGTQIGSLRNREGDLDEAERTRYEEIQQKLLLGLPATDLRDYARLKARPFEELEPVERAMLIKIENRMQIRLAVAETLPEYLGLEAKVRAGTATDVEKARLEQLRQTQFRGVTEMDLKDYARLSEKREKDKKKELQPVEEELMERLTDSLTVATMASSDVQEYQTLAARAGSLTNEERHNLAVLEEKLEKLTRRKIKVEEEIVTKGAERGLKMEWYNLFKAFNGAVDNINVTDQWRKAWHDLGAGAEDSFTQTRWAEYQKVSELMALMKVPEAGVAIQTAFKAMCLIGLNKTGDVPGSANIMQMEKLKETQVQTLFIEPIRQYVERAINEMKVNKMMADKGVNRVSAEAMIVPVADLYVNFGTEMARMLFENSFAAGWFMVQRDASGNIIYRNGGAESSDFAGRPYAYAEPAGTVKANGSVVEGDGSVYADRSNDYVKLMAARAKQMKEFAAGYETGLPALLPVLPDNLATPWVLHQEMVEIANGTKTLLEVFNDKPESSRWKKGYEWFRGAQVYDIVSKFVAGLKGFRSAPEEVDFFLKSPSNLGSLAKKIDMAMGFDKDGKREALRLKANMAMALIYSTSSNYTTPNKNEELKTIVPSSTEAKKVTFVNLQKDDYERIFARTGFIPIELLDYLFDKRLKMIYPDQGGKPELGLIKRSERVILDKYVALVDKSGRRQALANQV